MSLTSFINKKMEDKNIDVCQKNFWYMLSEIVDIYENETQSTLYFNESTNDIEEIDEKGFISIIDLSCVFGYFHNYGWYFETFAEYMIDNSINTLDNFEEFINIF